MSPFPRTSHQPYTLFFFKLKPPLKAHANTATTMRAPHKFVFGDRSFHRTHALFISPQPSLSTTKENSSY